MKRKPVVLSSLLLTSLLFSCGGVLNSNSLSTSKTETSSETTESQETSESETISTPSSESSESESSSTISPIISSSSSSEIEESSTEEKSSMEEESSLSSEESLTEPPIEESSEESSIEESSSEEIKPLNLEFPAVEIPLVKEGNYDYEHPVTAEMPTISIVSEDGDFDFVTIPDRLNKMDYTSCKVSVSGCDEKYALTEIDAGVKVRGNYTANYDKKPLRIKFNKKQGMLGLNNNLKAKSWVLLADVKDSSLLRNASAFYLGKRILGSDGYYVSDFTPVKVNINGEYWGVYLLVEQQQTGTGRIEITEPEDDQIDNGIGYLVEYDGYYTEEGPDGDPTFTINYNNGAALQGPNGRSVWASQHGYTIKSDIIADSQRKFASTYLEKIYRIAYKAAYNGEYYDLSSDGTTLVRTEASDPRSHIGRYIDLHSLVDTYILQEITCDPDIGWSSFYMDFDLGENKDHRLRFEAPWDYDSAIGNRAGYCEDGKGYYAFGSGNPWLNLLTGKAFFKEMIKAKWNQLVESDSFGDMLNAMYAFSSEYEEEYAENFQRWHHLGGSYSGTAGELRDETSSVKSEKDAFRFAADWYGDRLTSLSSIYGDGRDLHAPFIEEAVFPTEYEATRYEAENCSLISSPKISTDDTASGGKYVGNLDGGEGRGFGFSIQVEEDTTAYIAYGLAKQINSRDPAGMFFLKINGKDIDFPPIRYNPAAKNPDRKFHEWGEVKMGEIKLYQGDNIIKVISKGSATNFDYVDIYLPKK